MGYSVRTDIWRYTSWYNVKTETFEFPELYRISADNTISGNLTGNPEYADIETKLAKAVSDYKNEKYLKTESQ